MNDVFDAYAHYYDLLYRDKEYAHEAEYVADHIRKYTPETKRILELGCGTGAHAEHLARMGYNVYGVDVSRTMLARAEARKAQLPAEVSTRLKFDHGDVRTISTGETYDAVISLFHVMSYQTTNDDLHAAFSTARLHLRKGGVFLFDFWFGPAVLSDPPAVRVRRLENELVCVLRTAEPVMHYNTNTVDVDYQIIITNKSTRIQEELHETHRMRYLFLPEIHEYLSQHNFHHLHASEWLTEKLPGKDTWGVYCVAHAN